jgi:hypothetical protein
MGRREKVGTKERTEWRTALRGEWRAELMSGVR